MKQGIRFFLLSCSVLVFASGCASDQAKGKKICPQVAIIRELSHIGEGPTVDANAAMQRVEGHCAYHDKGVNVDFDLHMVAAKAIQSPSPKAGFPFFVTVLDDQDTVLAKNMMTAEFAFKKEDKISQLQESLHIFVPLNAPFERAERYRVLVGFQMTEDQIKGLRDKKR